MRTGFPFLDSGALQGLNRLLGLTGGPEKTAVDVANLQTVLDVADVVRRGQCLIPSDGVFTARFYNNFAAAGQVTGTIKPYGGTIGFDRFSPWPLEVPERLDVWILGAVAESSVAAAVDSMTLSVVLRAVQMAFSTTGQGAVATRFPLAFWDTFVTQQASAIYGVNENGRVWTPIGLRLPRGTHDLDFHADANAACEVQIRVLLGLFPAGLGQDALGAG